jgi:hypothetical protein
MRIKQILESVSAGGMGTGSIATAPAKAGKMIKREKGNLFAEGPNDGSEDNFTIDDIKRLEKIRDLETLKAQAKELIKGKPVRRMKPEKISWFYNHIDTLKNPLAVIKMMYDLMLAGEGHKVIGSRNSMSSNSYRSRFGEDSIEEISTGDYYKKATMQRAQAGMGAGFARSPEEREKNLAIYNKRDRGLNRLKDRNEKARAADQQKQMSDLVARLPELEAEYEQMRAKYKSLGGSNWQYADRDQNLTPAEREARDMEGQMNNLWRQIQAAKKHQGVAEGYNSVEKDYERWEQALYPHGNGASAFDLIDGDETTIRNILTYVKQNRHVLGYEVSPESGRTVKDAIINIRNEFPELYQAAQQPQGVAEGSLEEYGDTAKGQKMLTKVQKRAVDRVTSKQADTDPKYAKKNKDTADRAWDRMTDKDLEENKKGVRAVKHTSKAKGIEPPKPRNFVAKNAKMGGAGAHKDKKKAQKQGDTKHKAKEPAYESRLWAALERKILK